MNVNYANIHCLNRPVAVSTAGVAPPLPPIGYKSPSNPLEPPIHCLPLEPPAIPVCSLKTKLTEFGNKWTCGITLEITPNPVSATIDTEGTQPNQVFDNNSLVAWRSISDTHPFARCPITQIIFLQQAFDTELKELTKTTGILDLMLADTDEYGSIVKSYIDSLLITEKEALFNLLKQTPTTPDERVLHTTQITTLLDENPILVKATNEDGWTPLHLAANRDIAQALIEAGADVKATNEGGWTPLLLAVIARPTEVVTTLLDKGANVNEMNIWDTTPLHVAAYTGCKDLALTLLQAGADMTATDKDGHTPLQVAEYEKHEDVKQLLEKAQIALLNRLKQTPTDEKRTAYTEQATERLSQNPIPGKATTQDGDTPLHLVNKEGPTAIPQLHIANGG